MIKQKQQNNSGFFFFLLSKIPPQFRVTESDIQDEIKSCICVCVRWYVQSGRQPRIFSKHNTSRAVFLKTNATRHIRYWYYSFKINLFLHFEAHTFNWLKLF